VPDPPFSKQDSLRFHLATLPGMGPVSFGRLLSRFGSVSEVFEATQRELVEKAGIRRDLARTVALSGDFLDDTLEALEAFDSCGAKVVYSDSTEAPSRLMATTGDWHCLTVLGNLSLLRSGKAIAMVGRRRATQEGLGFAYSLAAEFGRRGIPTVSGMASGVDRASHLGSLSEKGGTVGVLPMGILRFLRENTTFSKAAEAGERAHLLLVSGAPPLQRWSVSEAMRRNKWIASWSDAVVVVEAGEKGGTWKTASSARKCGQPVWVATGFADQSAGVGNSYLVERLGGFPLDVREPLEEVAERVLNGSPTG